MIMRIIKIYLASLLLVGTGMFFLMSLDVWLRLDIWDEQSSTYFSLLFTALTLILAQTLNALLPDRVTLRIDNPATLKSALTKTARKVRWEVVEGTETHWGYRFAGPSWQGRLVRPVSIDIVSLHTAVVSGPGGTVKLLQSAWDKEAVLNSQGSGIRA